MRVNWLAIHGAPLLPFESPSITPATNMSQVTKINNFQTIKINDYVDK